MHGGETSLSDTVSAGNQDDSSKLQKIQIVAAGNLYHVKPSEQMTPNLHKQLLIDCA